MVATFVDQCLFNAIILSFDLVTQTASRAKEGPQRTYQGVATCKKCHAKQGGDTGLVKSAHACWAESRHAQAYKTLATERARQIARQNGVDDPQKADACLKCHVTGHGVAAKLLGKKFTVEDGVGCESCHGAGEDYYPNKVMKAIAAGETDPKSVGLIKPGKALCVECHTSESPTYQKFDFEERVKTIAHPIRAKSK